MTPRPMWRRYARFLGPNVHADVDEELHFHLEMKVRDLIARGMDPESARLEARRRFGDVERFRRECEQVGRSDLERQHRREWWAGVGRDLSHAARMLWKAPGFTAVAVLTLALGIGANTAVFSVVNSVLLRPLPVPNLERLAVIRESLPELNLKDVELAPAEVLDLGARRDVFDAVTGFRRGDRTLSGYGEPMRVSVAETLGDFAGVFSLRPTLGRYFGPEHSTGEGSPTVAVLSHGLWQQLTGGDSSVVGRTVQLNGTAYEIVGVMPAGFRYPRDVQMWVPFRMTDRLRTPEGRGSLMMTTVARLRPGVTDPQLANRLGDEARSWNEQYFSGSRAGKTLSSIGFVEHLVGPLRQILFVLMGAVVFVLLIAAANVAGLQLVRTSGRVREIAVRAAMGASRGRIARQLLIESGLLAVIGGMLGLAVGALSLVLLERWEPAQQMSISDISLDPRVLVFTGVLAIGSAVLFGTLPALRASRVDPQATLRDGGRGTSLGQGRSRLLRASVVVQLSLALVLLLGSGLMIRTLTRLLESDPGFQPDGLVTAELSIGGKEYGETARKLVFFDALLERVRALPGISEAALVWGLPFTDQSDSSPFDIPGRPARPGEPERHAEARIVSAGYFHTMRIPLLRGRDFNGSEREGSTTEAIVDRTFADQFFPGENPVGRQIIGYTGDPSTIIGVVDRVDQREIGDAPKAVVYYSYRQLPWSGQRSLVVRSSLPAAAVAAMLRSAVADLDRGVPLFDIQTMHDRIESTLGPRRLALLALGVFGALSLLLSSLGVYGVMRHVTRQRTQELGIRMAVGASPRQVLGLVLRQGVAVALMGITLGLIGALAVTRLMAGILYGVSPHDPIAVLGATALLLCVVLAASWAPAHRASRTDPVEALRAD